MGVSLSKQAHRQLGMLRQQGAAGAPTSFHSRDTKGSRASEHLALLSGDAEIGALIRAYDRASIPLGSQTDWPQGLKTAVWLNL